MPYLGTLTPEQAEKLGVPRSVSVISPAYGNRSKASTSSKSQPSNSGSETLESLAPSEASSSLSPDPMAPAVSALEASLQAQLKQANSEQ